MVNQLSYKDKDVQDTADYLTNELITNATDKNVRNFMRSQTLDLLTPPMNMISANYFKVRNNEFQTKNLYISSH